MQFNKGDIIVYENRSLNNGIKKVCLVIGVQGDWVLDTNAGNYLSNSFRLQDVIIWEHHRKK